MEKNRYLQLRRTLVQTVLPAFVAYAISASQLAFSGEPAKPVLGFEVVSKNYSVSANECDDYNFNYSRYRSAESEVAFLSVQLDKFNQDKSKIEQSIASMLLKHSELEDTKKEKIDQLVYAEEALKEAKEKTNEAKNAYKLCREENTREECQSEYEDYVAKRAEERTANTLVLEIKNAIVDADYDIEKIIRDIDDEKEKLDSISSKINNLTQTLDYNVNIIDQFVASYAIRGEVTTLNVYGDIEHYLNEGAFADTQAFYNMSVRRPAGVGPAIGALGHNDGYQLFSGLSIANGNVSWPTTDLPIGDEINAKLRQAFTELTHLQVISDLQSSCALREFTDGESNNDVSPRTEIVLDKIRRISIEGTYLVDIKITEVLQAIKNSTNRYGYISVDEFKELSKALPGFVVEQVVGVNEEELLMVSNSLKQDLLYRIVSVAGVPVVETQEVSCDAEALSLCGVYMGWWLSTPDSPVVPSEVMNTIEHQFTLATNQIDTFVYVNEPIKINLELNAPKPIICEEGQELVDGVCIDIPPTCEDGQELVNGVCIDIPVECEDGQELVDGVCIDIPPACEDGQELVDGVCIDIPPACEDDQELVDGVCIDIPAECEDGQELVNGTCVDVPPVCDDGEELIDDMCHVVPLECEVDEVLLDGVCQSNPCDNGEMFWWGICVPESWILP